MLHDGFGSVASARSAAVIEAIAKLTAGPALAPVLSVQW
jgi:hypothetical protein